MEPFFRAGSLNHFGPCALAVSPEPPTPSIIQGRRPAQLRSEVRRQCPRKPGVYGMLDGNGELIYIGKAKSLRARLLSYFGRGRDRKSGRIVRHARHIAWEVSTSEFAALHRELELIRRWRPRFNVQGQPQRRRFTHVCLGRQPAPHVFLARRPPASAVACFGPIPLGQRAREAARRLNDFFQLRDCPQPQEMVFADQDELFPVVRAAGCLRYEIGTCLGPCAAACSSASYAERVRAARNFLAGTERTILEVLEREMAAAAVAQQFERAAGLRDKLTSLRWLSDKLEQMGRLRETASFIYPVSGLDHKISWYLVHGGRTVAALAAPTDRHSFQTAKKLIEEIYQKKISLRLLEPYEHYDGLLLVASWFRRHPRERLRTMKPAAALDLCRNEK